MNVAVGVNTLEDQRDVERFEEDCNQVGVCGICNKGKYMYLVCSSSLNCPNFFKYPRKIRFCILFR